jgi:twitching motility two-component system response regulator PilG
MHVSQASATDLLREGIAAAKAGDKAQTRRLLREVTVLDPNNETAWLWLAGVAESPQEALDCLRRVLEINPGNDSARDGIKAARLQAAVAEAKAGNKAVARRYLLEVTEQDPCNETAWLWLAGMADSPHGMTSCLQKVLAINPKNEQALRGMTAAQLQAAVAEAQAGNQAAARRLLQAFTEKEPTNETAWHWLATVAESPQEAAKCWGRVLEINPNNEAAKRGLEACQPPPPPAPPPWQCPLCGQTGEETNQCRACGAILTLEPPEVYLANQDAQPKQLRDAIAEYETLVPKSQSGNNQERQPDFAVYYYLSIAHLNLREFDKAVVHLQAAAKQRPDDTALLAHLDRLSRYRPAPATPERKASEVNKAASQPRILIVDDSPTVRKLVTMTMEKNGYQVTAAANGYEATDRLLKNLPDLILLDISMPGIDGYQVCKLIKGNRETAAIPVVMLSGKDGFLDRIRGRMAGFTASITKPFKPEILVQVVKKYCRPLPLTLPSRSAPTAVVRGDRGSLKANFRGHDSILTWPNRHDWNRGPRCENSSWKLPNATPSSLLRPNPRRWHPSTTRAWNGT